MFATLRRFRLAAWGRLRLLLLLLCVILLALYAAGRGSSAALTAPARSSEPEATTSPAAVARARPMAGITDPRRIVQPAPRPRPPVGVAVVDPVFGTSLRRVSDSSERGGFESHIYNQLQAFSADNRYLLLTGSAGYLVRRVDDLSRVAGLDTSGWNDPRWHPTVAPVILHFDSNEDQIVHLQQTNVQSKETKTIFTFPPKYQYIRVPESFDEISEDGRWLAGLLTRADGAAVIFSLDIVQGRLGVEMPVADLYDGPCPPDPTWGDVEPDWIGVSPLGQTLVVQWVRDLDAGNPLRCSGLESFDIASGAFIGRISPHHHHGDLGLDAAGREIFMTTELSSPQDNNRPAIALRRLPGAAGASPPAYLQVVDWTNEDHYSLRGPAGVGLVSWGRFDDSGLHDFPFQGELFLQYTDGSVLRLVHHRSSVCGYWVQPRASLSRDGRYIVFASDWGQESGGNSCGGGADLGRGDPYLIDLGAPALEPRAFLPLALSSVP